jgi:DNA repair protein RadC
MHNHPRGDPKPSRDDIEMTREIKAAMLCAGLQPGAPDPGSQDL